MTYAHSSMAWKLVFGALFLGAIFALWLTLAPQRSAQAAPPCADPTPCSQLSLDLIGKGPIIDFHPPWAPNVAIDSPADGDSFRAYGVSSRSCIPSGRCSEFAADVNLIGHATDSRGNKLTGSYLTWTIQQYDIWGQPANRPIIVGVGESATVRLYWYGNFFFRSTPYDITLQATDNYGNTSSETIKIAVYRPNPFTNSFSN